MIPRELFAGQRIIAMVFCIAFIGGINFYSIVNFFPLTFSHVYYPDPVQVGLKALGPSIYIALVATRTNVRLTALKGRGKELLLFNSVLMSEFSNLRTLSGEMADTVLHQLPLVVRLPRSVLPIPIRLLVSHALPALALVEFLCRRP